MFVDEAIREALNGIVDVIVPNVYTGDKLEYIVFNYSEYPDLFGDDTGEVLRNSVQVHYICPHGKNPNMKKRQIRAAITGLDASPPVCINANDAEQQHYVYEFMLVSKANGEV